MGGHSNQLFQYAAGRQLAVKNNTNLYLDISWFDSIPSTDTHRVYELDVYPLNAEIIDTNVISIRSQENKPTIQEKIYRKIGIDKRIWIQSQEGNGFDKSALLHPDNTMLVGWWQSEKFFPNIREELLSTIEPIKSPSIKNQKIIDEINNSESIWMHIRRGDYVTNKHARDFHGSKDKNYYYNSLKLLTSKLPESSKKNIKIFVCSNDLAWCRKELQLPYPVRYIENRLGSEDMRVAKHCKHDIIANSSFSWWGAWLNEHTKKIIIAPKTWFEDPAANNETSIVPEGWFRV